MDDLPDKIRRWSDAAASNALPPVTAEEASESSIPALQPADTRPPRRRQLVLAVAAVAIVVVGVGAALWDRDDDRRGLETAAAPTIDPAGATAVVDVRLEPVDGYFIEGFEVGLRFERADGTKVASTLWTDAVVARGSTEIADFYDFVLTQVVPAGEPVVLRAEVTKGSGPPASTPNLDGPLPCRLDLDLDEGAKAVVEVAFDAGTACLRLVETIPPAVVTATTSTTPDDTSTSGTTPAGNPTTSTSTSASTTSTGQPSPTTEPVGSVSPLAVGSQHYVDVDLECEAFELSGTWVVDTGDPSTWQPPGERHEGGTFTIDEPTHGTFRGDYAGTKVATFRLLGPAEALACRPVPR